MPEAAPAQQHVGLKGNLEAAQMVPVSREEAKEYKENLKWELYDAYQLLVTRSGTGALPEENDPAFILVLKGSGVSVDFHGQKLGAGGLKPTASDVKSSAQNLLKQRVLRLFRVTARGDEKADLAILIVPKWVKPTMTGAGGDHLSFRISDSLNRSFLEFAVSPGQ